MRVRGGNIEINSRTARASTFKRAEHTIRTHRHPTGSSRTDDAPTTTQAHASTGRQNAPTTSTLTPHHDDALDTGDHDEVGRTPHRHSSFDIIVNTTTTRVRTHCARSSHLICVHDVNSGVAGCYHEAGGQLLHVWLDLGWCHNDYNL
jgi:hypothetical protein